MKFSTSFLLAAFAAVPAVVYAQQTFNVTVGASGLTFVPAQVTAAIGDTINFEFHAKNHTVSQSTFAAPCTYNPSGVDSGFVPVASDATEFPVWSIKINEVSPLWFFCAQGAHCTSGMVFAVNVNATSPNTFDAYMAKAKAAGVTFGGAASNGTTSATGTATGGASQTGTASGSSSATATSAAPNDASRLVSFSSGSAMAALMGVAASLALL